MDCKTHAAIGSALALTVLSTNDPKVLIGGTALAVAGSYLPDIDTEKSKGAQTVRSLLGGVAVVTLLGFMLQTKCNVNVLEYITGNKTLSQMLPALAVLVAVLVIGMNTLHRSFTHSIIGVIAITTPVYMLVGSLYTWFLVGYVAHIVADTLNKKEVQILYPIKKGICFYVCKASGVASQFLFVGASVVVVFRLLKIMGISL